MLATGRSGVGKTSGSGAPCAAASAGLTRSRPSATHRRAWRDLVLRIGSADKLLPLPVQGEGRGEGRSVEQLFTGIPLTLPSPLRGEGKGVLPDFGEGNQG